MTLDSNVDVNTAVSNTPVTVIMPVYNEEKYIVDCIESLCKQTYGLDKIEWLFIDGMSSDKTVELIESFSDRLNLKILNNEKRKVTYALNIGIENATGDIVIRMDAHASYAEDYIEKCVYNLLNSDADNVGGVAETVGRGFVGAANAEILSSKFGVGNSRFRTGAASGYVDTVPFGAFRREIFDKIGRFNVDLPRSEDNDFNSRIRASGGKVYLSTDIRFKYYCRDTVGGLLNQGIKNGNSLFLTLRKNPKAMSVRHFIPFLFVLSLIVVPIVSIFFFPFVWVLTAELGLYLLLDICFSFQGKKKHFFYKLFMYPLFHISYGIGSWLGLFCIKLY